MKYFGYLQRMCMHAKNTQYYYTDKKKTFKTRQIGYVQ